MLLHLECMEAGIYKYGRPQDRFYLSNQTREKKRRKHTGIMLKSIEAVEKMISMEPDSTITVEKTSQLVQDLIITTINNTFQCKLPFWQYQTLRKLHISRNKELRTLASPASLVHSRLFGSPWICNQGKVLNHQDYPAILGHILMKDIKISINQEYTLAIEFPMVFSIQKNQREKYRKLIRLLISS